MSKTFSALKSDRKICGESRDKYFDCIDVRGEENCVKEKKVFEESCPTSWVYFI